MEQRSGYEAPDRLGEVGRGREDDCTQLGMDIPGKEGWRRTGGCDHFHSLSPELWKAAGACLGLGHLCSSERKACVRQQWYLLEGGCVIRCVSFVFGF